MKKCCLNLNSPVWHCLLHCLCRIIVICSLKLIFIRLICSLSICITDLFTYFFFCQVLHCSFFFSLSARMGMGDRNRAWRIGIDNENRKWEWLLLWLGKSALSRNRILNTGKGSFHLKVHLDNLIYRLVYPICKNRIMPVYWDSYLFAGTLLIFENDI